MLMTVYSPDGKMFENVILWRARKLVIEDGWTFTHPSEVKPPFNEPVEVVEEADEFDLDDDDYVEEDEDSVFDDASVE